MQVELKDLLDMGHDLVGVCLLAELQSHQM
jgi:hypothetical protein